MLRNFRYSHGGKSFNVDAVEIKSGQTVVVQVFIFLAVQNERNQFPYGFRYLDEQQGRRIHYTPEEFYKLYDIPPADREEIDRQRQFM